jgi:hypothetical protein
VRRLLCKMIGHVRYAGWWGDALYGPVSGGYTDGIGRSHYQIRLKCDRCGERYTAARFHGPEKLTELIRGERKVEA